MSSNDTVPIQPVAVPQSHHCAMCNITFTTRERFDLHITKSHPRCSTCGIYFKDTELLNRHQNQTNCKGTSNKITSMDLKLKKSKPKYYFTCLICKNIFDDKKTLKCHQQAKAPGFEFTCCSCRVLCKDENEFAKHLNGHQCSKCHVCGQNVYYETLLPWHFTLKHTDMVDISEGQGTVTMQKPFFWPCSNCKSFFPTSQSLASHQKECLVDDTSFPKHCKEIQPEKSTMCTKTSQTTSDIRIKSKVNFIWKCSSCKIKFATKELFLAHNRKLHPYCAVCNKQFIDRQSLNSHQRAKKLGFQFKCCRCNVVCRDQTEFDWHINGHQARRCHVCGYKVVLEIHLPGHFESNHFQMLDISESNPILSTVQKGKIFCTLCMKIFDSKKSLISHRRELHTECFACGIGFFPLHVNELKIHQSATKAGYLFKCCTCKVNCKTQDEFDSHLCGHISNKCHICEQTFDNGTLLQHHYKAEHSEITESSQCTFCKITFANSDLLDAHYSKWHTECLVCDRNFEDKVSLKKHQQYKGQGFLFKCCLCDTLCRKRPEFEEHINSHLLNKCNAMVTDQSTIPNQNVGNIQSIVQGINVKQQPLGQEEDSNYQLIGQCEKAGQLPIGQNGYEQQQKVSYHEYAIKQTCGVDQVPLSQNNIKDDDDMDKSTISESVVPNIKLKKENLLITEEIVDIKGSVSENPYETFHFFDTKDYVNNREHSGADTEKEIYKDDSATKTGENKETIGVSLVKSEPVPGEIINLDNSALDDNSSVECALDTESQPNVTSDKVFDIKEESNIEGIKPMKGNKIIYLNFCCGE